MYISIAEENKPQYNDVPILCDEQAYRNLREHGKHQSNPKAQEETLKLLGVDELLSRHVASLFARKPLIAYSDDFSDKDPFDMKHFNVRAHLPIRL